MPLTDTQICTRPAASLVASIRARHGYTQLQCSYIVGCAVRTWQRYETKGGMEIGVWWCFLLRIGEIREPHLPNIPPRQRASAVLAGLLFAVGIWAQAGVNHPL